MPDYSTGSTIARRQLGRELKHLREAAGLLMDPAAELLEWSRPKLWRIEGGGTAMRSLDVEAMCRTYRAPPEITRALMTLAKHTKDNAWWYPYTDVIPTWFDMYLGLEATADRVREYASEFVPGLLQTDAYARAVFSLPCGPVSQTELNRRVEVRMARQDLLRSRHPAPLSAVYFLNEAVFRRPVGSSAVMAAQLAHIVQVSALPKVAVHVIPFEAGAYTAGITGSFSLLEFHDGLEPSVAYQEGLTGALYLEDPREVASYKVVLDDLGNKSLSEHESQLLLAEVAKGYHHA